jgi:hypothetical protein
VSGPVADRDPAWATSGRSGRAADVLRRVLDVAARVARGLTRLAVAAAVSVVAAWLAWVVEAAPADGRQWLVRAIVLAILLAPSAVLLLFLAGLRELRELPERARSLPADVRVRAAELRERSSRTREPRGTLGLLVALARLGRLVLGSRDVLTPYAAVAAALRPPVLLAALAAAVAAAVEIPAALVALLFLLA